MSISWNDNTQRPGLQFPPLEIAELVVAAFLLGGMFLIAFGWPLYFAVLIGSALIIHELAHKIVGSLVGIDRTNFMLVPLGIVIGYISAFVFGIMLAAPGGVTVGTTSSDREKLIMAVAGPASNYVAFLVLLGLHHVVPLTVVVGGMTVPLFYLLALVNLYLAFFNFLPIPFFDGSHIIRINPVVWGIGILVTGVTTVLFWGEIGRFIAPLFQMKGVTLGLIGTVIVREQDAVDASTVLAHTPDYVTS